MSDIKVNEFTILMQGKMFPETIDYANEYKKIGFDMIISSYENTNTDIPIIINDIEEAKKLSSEKTRTTSSGKFQIFSTFNGLLNIKNKYVIKTRTDEFYNLYKILQLFLKNDTKIVFHNLYYRPSRDHTGYFHISDKLLIGKSENILSMFSTAYAIVNGKKQIKYNPKCIEDLLGYSYLLDITNFDEQLCLLHRDRLINHCYDFINFTELKPFKMKFNSVSNEIYTENTIDKEHNMLWTDSTKKLADILWKNN